MRVTFTMDIDLLEYNRYFKTKELDGDLWQSMTLSLPTVTEGGRKVNQMTSKFISRNLQMIDNPLPDQVMAEKTRYFTKKL